MAGGAAGSGLGAAGSGFGCAAGIFSLAASFPTISLRLGALLFTLLLTGAVVLTGSADSCVATG